MTKERVAPLPIIDLGAHLQVIDGNRWRTICTVSCASRKNILKAMQKHHLKGVWIRDTTGDRYYKTVDDFNN